MAKLTLNDITNLSNENSVVTAINNNSALIETAVENTLSRDGTTPNTMGANLDMNNNKIVNLPAAITSTEPVRKAEFDTAIAAGISDGDKGDITVSSAGTVWTLDSDVVPVFDGTNAGLVPDPLGATTTFLKADGIWAAPTVGGLADADYGDITVSGTGAVMTVDNDAITYDKIQNVSNTSRILGRITAGAGNVEELTGTQATTLLDNFTDSLKGLTPLSGGGTTNYLRADGTWDAPPGTGGIADADYGDIVVTGSGTTWTIDNNAATYSKIQNVSATDKLLGRSTAGSGNVEEITCTAAGRALLDDANVAAQRTTLGLVIGTDVMAADPELTALAGTTSAANKLPYYTGSGTASTTDFTVQARALLDDTTAAAMASTIGLGTSSIPQFAGIELGHSSDTSLDRVSSGVVSIEGSNILTASGLGTITQAYDASLADIAGITFAQGDMLYHDGSNLVNLPAGTDGKFLKTQGAGANPTWAAIAGGGDMLAANNLSDLVDKPTGRTNLGVGTTDSPQFAAVNIGAAADTTLTRVSAGVVAVEGSNILLASGLGSVTQAYDSELNALAGLSSAANKLPYFTGSGTATVTDFTAAARTVLDDATVGDMAATLGVAKLAGNQTLTGGFITTGANLGTITGANQTITPDYASGQHQYCTLNGTSLTGTLTINPPAASTQTVLEVTNGGAGAVAATLAVGATKTDGTWVSTNGSKFIFILTTTQNYSHCQIIPLQ